MAASQVDQLQVLRASGTARMGEIHGGNGAVSPWEMVVKWWLNGG